MIKISIYKSFNKMFYTSTLKYYDGQRYFDVDFLFKNKENKYL